jgi:hypothetical protein
MIISPTQFAQSFAIKELPRIAALFSFRVPEED